MRTDTATRNCIDRTVAYGETYYYKVSAKDTCGNAGEASACVRVSIHADETAPILHSIHPAGGAVSESRCTVSALASDNNVLQRVVLEYSLDGENYTVFSGTAVSTYYTTCSAALPVSACADGDTIYVRAWAMDAAGLQYRAPGTSVYVQGVEVELDYNGQIPQGFEVIELPAAKYLMFQGEPFKEEDYCEAIEAVQKSLDNYDPAVIGYKWDESNPRIQLEPIGTRGYIELKAIV